MRFNFPRTDPSEDILNYIDQQSDFEKLRDILCVWHKLIPEPLLNLYNGIVERDLSRHLQLKSGIPITKSVIDKEIKNFRISNQERELLLQKVPPQFSVPDPGQNLASPPDPLASEYLQIPLPANLDITQPVHYTETESDHARLSMAKTDTFLVPILSIAKLNTSY